MRNALLSLGLITSLTASLAAAGCGGRSFGEPKEATASQKQAVTQSNTSVEQMGKLKTNASAVVSLYGIAASIGTLAVAPAGAAGQSLRSEGDAPLLPMDLPAGCITGDGTTGWTYTKCGDSGNEINGTVKFSGDTTTINLSIKVPGQTTISIVFNGSITTTATKVTGDLTYEYKIDLGPLGGLGGLGGLGNIKTTITYDITYSGSPVCISAGTLTIDSSTGASSGAAKFEFTGCGTYKVRNG